MSGWILNPSIKDLERMGCIPHTADEVLAVMKFYQINEERAKWLLEHTHKETRKANLKNFAVLQQQAPHSDGAFEKALAEFKHS